MQRTSFSSYDEAYDEADEATVEVKDWVRAHYVTILQVAYNRLEPGQFLDDSLVDFWMRWYDHSYCLASHDIAVTSSTHFPTPYLPSTLQDQPRAISLG